MNASGVRHLARQARLSGESWYSPARIRIAPPLAAVGFEPRARADGYPDHEIGASCPFLPELSQVIP